MWDDDIGCVLDNQRAKHVGSVLYRRAPWDIALVVEGASVSISPSAPIFRLYRWAYSPHPSPLTAHCPARGLSLVPPREKHSISSIAFLWYQLRSPREQDSCEGRSTCSFKHTLEHQRRYSFRSMILQQPR